MDNIIVIENLHKSFGKTEILHGINKSFERSKIHGLVGNNGSGKTVLMKCICGFLIPDSGKVTVNGKVIGKDTDFPQNTGIIIETPGFLPSVSGYENLRLLASLRHVIGKEVIYETMKTVGLDPVTLYDKYMPKSALKNGDPWTTFVGDAKGVGYGCYAPCIVTTGNKYLESVGSSKSVSDVSHHDFAYYENLVDNGTPVIMWATTDMNADPSVCWKSTINGKQVKWHKSSHCVVLIGYTDNTYIFCDPLNGIAEYEKMSVEKSFSIVYNQACIIE